MVNPVAIVILTWNGFEITARCLDSLFESFLPETCEVIIVDNGSTDGTVDALRQNPKIRLIENGTNLGYAKAVNIGIQAANPGADIVLLNNDVQLIEKDWLIRLQQTAITHPDFSLLGVKILKDDKTLQHCGAYLPTDTLWGQQIAADEVDINQYPGLVEVESVVFACAYIPRLTIVRIGLLSEDFFAYFEDTDYCMRLHLAGLKVGMCGGIRVLHSENSSTKINKVSHSKIFLNSQATFKNKWCTTLADSRYQHQLDWHSIVNFPSGYAGSSRAFMESLDRLQTRVSYQYVYGPGTVFPLEEPQMSDSYVVNMLRSRPFGDAEIQVVYAQGDVFNKNSGKYKIGFTMLEVNGLPDEWVRQSNQMDEIWVPSTFNVQTFRDSGVQVPIHVIPLGIDENYFNPDIKGMHDSEDFTFLSVFEWGERKAPEILIKAFSDEFRHNESVRLVCKSNNFDPSVSIKAQIEQLHLSSVGGRIVIAENRILKNYELGVLYNSADCFVLPSRGEGWGMPILEAMACGLPVIATNWSSQTDFMNERNALPLEIDRLIPAVAKCPYYQGFDWAEPSYEHLRQLMRWVYEHQEAAKEIGTQASKDARSQWTWRAAAEKIQDRISKLQ